MNNKYSKCILWVMLGLFLLGVFLLLVHTMWGFVPLLMAAYMTKGFTKLQESPLEVGIITVWGVKVPVVVKGLTLVLDWLPIPVIGVVSVSGRTENTDFEKIEVLCKDGATVTGKISISIVVDIKDDPWGYRPVSTSDRPMTAGEKLILFDDNGQFEGVLKQLKDILISYIKTIGKEKTYGFMTTETLLVDGLLRDRIMGIGIPENQVPGSNASGSIRTMGLALVNIQGSFEQSKKVKDASENSVLEDLQRNSEGKDTETYIRNIEKFLAANRAVYEARKANGEDPGALYTFEQARAIIDDQRLLAAGSRQTINTGGGKTVNVVTGQGNKQGTT